MNFNKPAKIHPTHQNILIQMQNGAIITKDSTSKHFYLSSDPPILISCGIIEMMLMVGYIEFVNGNYCIKV